MRVISGAAKGILLKTPDGLATRPTADRVKEALFSIIQFELQGTKVLDLFGGTGQLGIEALSRGAKSCVFVDESKDACKLIQENLKRTKLEHTAQVICGDYAFFLKKCRESFDIVFLDPPYAEKFLENSLNLISEIDILQSGGIIVTERPVGKDLVCELPGYSRSKDYKYSKTILTLFRKN
ncbi:MAG: 16S rRNA (guanine(966)-N(2))-methyltransferase RsmD [Ruminococcaceae bacterium]|nr:16S rRNA (guanine(966)-N(2))-methyltransferase RsmD [Oscillospiraceae bacterium]